MTNPQTDADMLAKFWRKGRKQFVDLSVAEVERAGIDRNARMRLVKRGLIRSECLTSAGRYDAIFIITDAGRAMVNNV